MKRIGIGRLLATCCLALLLPAGGIHAAEQRLNWEHPGLDLYLSRVTDLSDRAELGFTLRTRAGVDRAETWIGFPRYQQASRRWGEAIIRGVAGRNRTVTLAGGGSFAFSVIVPRTAAMLTIPVGDHTVHLDASDWIDPISEVTDRPTFTASPGLPVQLVSELRWTGAKPFGDGALDAEEQGELLIDVANGGQRTASAVKVRVRPESIDGVSYPAEVAVAEIPAGQTVTVRLPIQADGSVIDASSTLHIEVVEPFGHDATPIAFNLVTRSIDPPELVLTDDFALDGADLPIPRDRIVTLQLRVRNVGHGVARGVAASVKPGDGVFTAHDGSTQFDLGDIEPGQVRSLPYRCYANRRAGELAVEIDLTDGRNRDIPSAFLLTLPLEDSGSVPRIVQVDPDPRPQRAALAPPPPPLTSDVDRHVPLSAVTRPDAVAVVLGVERYSGAPAARYAAADARTAARYFEHALGIPAERTELLVDEDVTLAHMNRLFGRDGWLARRVEENTEVFVFFAGHGVAESETFDPYLMPHDGDLNYTHQTGFSLDTLVERLAALDAGHVTLFLDACFSGLTREGGPLRADTRSLVVVPVQRGLSGVSVLSAARGSQTAHSLDEHGHGLFSYFLFKGLGGAADINRDNSVTTGELAFFLEDEVSRAAALADREQTPSSFVDDMERELVRLP